MNSEKEANTYVQDIEGKSIDIIREAKAQFKNIACLWNTGKDQRP